jgi:hypothetical protein
MIANNIKNKPKIEDVKIDLEELNSIIKLGMSDQRKNYLIRRLVAGTCTICAGIPSKIVKYKLKDITRIEWYSEKCFERF